MPSTTDGDLTLSGDLYEGNFPEWEVRMLASIRTRSLYCYIGCQAEAQRKRRPRESRRTAQLIQSHTSDAMLKRVPASVKLYPEQLMEALKTLATPFRLFELPAEIRNSIYVYALPACHVPHENSLACEEDPYHEAMPALLHANSQIRREALSLFYSTTVFQIWRWLEGGDEMQEDRETLEYWLNTIVGDNAKHLRHAQLHLRASACVHVIFCPKHALSCEFDYDSGGISDGGMVTLAEHAVDVESTRKALKLKGEGIVIAMLMNGKLWEQLKDETLDNDEMDEDD